MIVGRNLAMPVSITTIRPKVHSALKKMIKASGEKNPVVADNKTLSGDLGMSAPLKKAMGTPYTKISKSYGGITVSLDDAGDCVTVLDAVSLTHERANGLR